MADYKALQRIVLRQSHARTGKTKHFKNGTEVQEPVELRIVKYPNDSGYYLFYCDENGKEITDTYHDSLDEAKSQAEWEFNVKSYEWDIFE